MKRRGGARPWLCARHRAAAARRAACETSRLMRDDGNLQRVVRPDPDAAPGRRRLIDKSSAGRGSTGSTTRDLGALVRGFPSGTTSQDRWRRRSKAIVRADRIATRFPQRPVCVARRGAQEETLTARFRSLRSTAIRVAAPAARLRARGGRVVRPSEGGAQAAAHDRPRIVRPRRFCPARRAGRAARSGCAHRHQDRRELSDTASASTVSAVAVRDGQRERIDPRRRCHRELRLDRPRRHARASVRR